MTLLRIADVADFDELLEQVRQSSRADIVVEVDERSDLLASAAEHRILATLARELDVHLRVDTDDPIRLELARIYGLHDIADAQRLRERPEWISTNEATRKSENISPTEPATDHFDLTTEEISEAPESSGERPDFDDVSQGSFSFVISPPVPRRPDIAEPPTWDLSEPKRARHRRRTAPLLMGSIVVVLLGIGILLAGMIAPWMRVTAAPATAPVTVDVTVGLAGSAENLDVVLEPRTISRTLESTVTLPATGVRLVPDGTATGIIMLTNASTTERIVEAGTYFAGPGEVGFVTSEEVVVPPADPFGTLTFGSATVAVAADVPGLDGNVNEGEISGQLDDDLFYTNRTATTGGTVREITFVQESDIASAREAARAQLDIDPTQALARELQVGEKLLPDSTEVGDVEFGVDRQPGEDAAEVTVRAVRSISGEAYDPSQLQEAGIRAVQERLAAAVPGGWALVARSVDISEPSSLSDVAAPAYRFTAEATLTRLIENQEIEELRDALVGASATEIDTILAGWDSVESIQVERGPSWLPWDVPVRLGTRVEIDLEQPETESP